MGKTKRVPPPFNGASLNLVACMSGLISAFVKNERANRAYQESRPEDSADEELRSA